MYAILRNTTCLSCEQTEDVAIPLGEGRTDGLYCHRCRCGQRSFLLIAGSLDEVWESLPSGYALAEPCGAAESTASGRC